MSLVAGTRLGPYEIQSAIGAGGMGEVYKARDTRLDRTVAIKVLPAELSSDPERRARFEREAKTIAGLSHPHICTLHDIGSHDGTTYLVMEHLQGDTLAERLLRGPLPAVQALEFGAQIADALDAAHRRGIIHRDLKPANVMLTTGSAGRSGAMSAKLLDFGLAKLARHGERPALVSETHAVTEAAPVTARGTIVGTLQYMAPEQLEGKEADARTDLWALGAMLYEMLSGRRPFAGDSEVSLIGHIMNGEPAPLAALQPLTPPSLNRVITKCLAKRPDDRWDTAHDVADELRWLRESSGAQVAGPAARPRDWLRAAVIGAAGLGLMAIGAGVMWVVRPAAPPPLSVHSLLDISPADEVNAGGGSSFIPTPGGSRTALTWTPDGRALVFVGRRGATQQLYVRRLEAAEAQPLANTEKAQILAVSPDGKWVAFWAGGAIKKVPTAGGVAAEVASGITQSPDGLIWDAQGGLFFGRRGEGIWTIPPDGKPAAVTTVGEAEVAHTLPSLLPGGRVLLYTVRKREWSWGDENVVAQPLPTGDRRLILTDATDARYVPATGHLLFLRRGALWAVPFDPDRLRPRGQAVPILDGVAQALTAGNYAAISGAGQFAVSQTGTLAWVPGRVAGYLEQRLVTVDRRGQVTVLSPEIRSYGLGVRLSPDGRRLAVSVLTLQERGIWVCDLARGTLAPLNRDGESSWPVWTTDGRRIAFSWLRDGRSSLALQGVDDQSAAQVLAPGVFLPSSWNADGRTLAGVGGGRNGGDVLISTDERGKATVQPLWETSVTEQHPAFSPDGRWLAYVSNVSDSNAVYIRPYPGPGEVTLASPDRCSSPAWNPRGGELFFIGRGSVSGRLVMMAVDIAPGPALRVGPPRVLFEFDALSLQLNAFEVRAYDVAPDGQRFYGVQLAASPSPPPVTYVNLIQNWFEELKAKVPAGGAK